MPFNRLTGVVLLTLSSQAVYASGFALIEQSASGQGLSYAGAAANAEDASVMWFNPAGLTQIEGNQAIAGIHFIAPKTAFSDNGSTITVPGPTVIATPGNDNGATNAVVPNLYWKGNVGDYAVGLGINAPFGSKIEYEDTWAGRYQGTKTQLTTINLNANIARKINDYLSVGAGVNAQYVHLIMAQKINQAIVVQPDGNAEIDADSIAYGYNLGLMAKLSDKTDLGLAYRSEVTHNAKGTVNYSGVHAAIMAGGSLVDGSTVRSSVSLPASASVSLSHQANDKLTVLADVTWTGWKAYDELVVTFDSGASSSESDQDFGDSRRYSLGAIYDLNSQWTLRTGVALDKTPVPNDTARSVRTPDNDRTWLSFGANYKLNNSMSVDMGYTHISSATTGINKTVTTGTGTTNVVGSYELAVDILSAQLVWNY